MEYLFIYLLQVFETIEIISIVMLACLIILIGTIITYGSVNLKIFDEDIKKQYKNELVIFNNLKKITITVFITTIIMFFIPTKQTLALIGGIYYGKMAAKQVITSEKIKKVNEIIDLQLDKVIKELKQ